MSRGRNRTNANKTSENGRRQQRSGGNRNGNRRGGAPFNKRNGYGTKGKESDALMEGADIDAKYSRSNPVEFYTKTGQYAADAAKLPFARPTGTIYDITWAGKNVTTRTAVPGVCALYFAPSIGVSHDSASPINRASIRFYTRLRSQQKVSTEYDHQDITMMEVALDSAIMFHALVRRAIGLVDAWTPINDYYPQTLLSMCGFSARELRQNIQQLRGWANSFAYSMGQYVIPSDLSLIKRHQWMCEGMYTDSTGSKAQTFIWVPTGFWKYDNTVETGSQLVWEPWMEQGETSPKVHTIQQIMDFGEDLLQALSNDNDFSQIGGDLYRYYGGRSFELPYTEEGYKILPQYDQTVLSQIENAVICGQWAADYTPVISQNPSVNSGAILFEPKMLYKNFGPANNQMNFHWEHPSSDQVLEASRLIATFEVPDTSSSTIALRSCGTEILQWMLVAQRHEDKTNTSNTIGNLWMYFRDRVHAFTGSSAADVMGQLKRMCALQKFDWAPRVIVCSYDIVANTVSYLGDTWDTDVMDDIPNYYMDQINRACLFSLFDTGVGDSMG